MIEAQQALRELRDPALPALPSLLGDEAEEILHAVVSSAGGSMLRSRPRQIHWKPGRSITVVYETLVQHHGAADPTTEMLVASTGGPPREGALELVQGDSRVAVWTISSDPGLPGLAVALDAQRARILLDSVDAPAGPIRTRLRAYRPGRRAVVEVHSDAFRAFLKIVPPSDVSALQAKHKALSQDLPVPRSHGWSDELGMVVLEPLAGLTLREQMAQTNAPLPDPAEIAILLNAIRPPEDAGIVGGPLAAVRSHARLLRALLPAMAPRIADLRERLRNAPDPGDDLVPIHGDLHEAQLMVQDGAISGLLDIDTVGYGRRVDDWANMIGHLFLRLESARGPEMRERLRQYGRHFLTLAETETDPADLRRRIAAVVMALATGPFRAQTVDWPAHTARRIDAVERWLESAEALRLAREKTLTRPS